MTRAYRGDMPTAADLMSHPPVTVGLDETLAGVKQIFDTHSFHHLLVVERFELVGVLSDRDLLTAISPYLGTLSEASRDVATLNKHVHQVMSHHPITVHPETPLAELVRLFAENDLSCLPVVDHHQHPLGVVSWRDLLPVLVPPADH